MDLFTSPPHLMFQALRTGTLLFEDRPGRHLACVSLAARMSADSARMERYKELYLDRALETLRA